MKKSLLLISSIICFTGVSIAQDIHPAVPSLDGKDEKTVNLALPVIDNEHGEKQKVLSWNGKEYVASEIVLTKEVNGIFKSGDVISKPKCSTGEKPHIYISPVSVEDTKEGQPLTGFRTYANSTENAWEIATEVKTYKGWQTEKNDKNLLSVTIKCNK